MKKEEEEEKKEKEENRIANPGKKKVKSCGWYCLRVPHMCLITKMSLSYELWKLKTAKSCFQFP